MSVLFTLILETLTYSHLCISRHFRCETIEVVTRKGSKHDNQIRAYALFSDLETDEGEDNLYDAISSWATGTIVERKTYFKVLPIQNYDLYHYLVIHVIRCKEVSVYNVCFEYQ